MTRTLGLIVALAVVVAVVLLVGPAACNKIRSLGAQARLGQEQLNAAGESGRDAVGTVGNAAARERASDELSRTNEEEIRNAPGADATVDPAVRDAGKRSLCRRAAYRDRPECRLFEPGPR